MRDGSYCSCGNSSYAGFDGVSCDVPCNGDNTTICGGSNEYTVYTTKMSTKIC